MYIASTDMNAGMNRLLGLEFTEFGPDGGSARVRIDERHHQPWGIVHGGLYCALVETVASISGTVWLESRDGGSCVGVNNNTDFLRAVPSPTASSRQPRRPSIAGGASSSGWSTSPARTSA
jgi:1,4-dihydroxy-2-naphthoyl-CoA hydrolase